ncbi:hypothetical protein IWX83_001038 [Flavobacterium sp. CG_9.1]|uniref:Uncharacterized protein n=1 Tax=Flavobacterium xanthum TaxID=69322 RepID=A0A1M6YVI0_9FLAO|nr:hypothetical protein [Flavobacterium sp. CG_9.1]SHL22276.1 hypothetical protein SAMN05443669_100426 [Flavobacterium xanthum]
MSIKRALSLAKAVQKGVSHLQDELGLKDDFNNNLCIFGTYKI